MPMMLMRQIAAKAEVEAPVAAVIQKLANVNFILCIFPKNADGDRRAGDARLRRGMFWVVPLVPGVKGQIISWRRSDFHQRRDELRVAYRSDKQRFVRGAAIIPNQKMIIRDNSDETAEHSRKAFGLKSGSDANFSGERINHLRRCFDLPARLRVRFYGLQTNQKEDAA